MDEIRYPIFSITGNMCMCTAGYSANVRRVSGVAEKLSNMKVSSTNNRPLAKAQPMKSGGWNGQSDSMFSRRSHEFLPPRTYSKKVAG